MSLHIPTLRTARLALVGPSEAHFESYVALYGDPVVMQHIGPPMDRGEAWKLLARHAGHWMLRGYGGWLVQLKASGNVVGLVGLQFPEGNPELELGWVFHPQSWGQGYATEAARAALAYAFDAVGAPRVMARIAPANAGSIAVARKLGMRHDAALSDDATSVFLASRG